MEKQRWEESAKRMSKKNARRCGAKHISKSKVLKTDGFGPLLEIVMSKKCTPLWREAHLDVEKVHAVVARSTLPSQKCKKLWGLEHFWMFRCRFAWQAHGILHLANNEQNVGVLWQFQTCWHAWNF